MANLFAAIETSINQRAIGMLANAEADFGGGLVVSGIFDAEPMVDFNVQSSGPQFKCLEASVTTVLRGAPLTINGISYTVKSKPKADIGMQLLELQKA